MTGSRGPTIDRTNALAVHGAYLGMFVAVLSQTVLATTLPNIIEEIGGFEHYAWVFTVYGLAVTVTMPIAGQITDARGRSPVFVLGATLFMLGGGLCAASHDLVELMVGRGIQGLGAGAMLVIAMVTVGDLIPARDRARWHALAGANFVVAALLGPLIGGLLSEHGHWRLTFIVPLPLCLLALSMAYPRLRRLHRPHRDYGPDYVGAALLAVALTAALIALSSTGDQSDNLSRLTAPSLVLMTLGFISFVVRETSTQNPLVPPGLLFLRQLIFPNAASFFVGAALFSAMMLLPLLWQAVLSASAAGSAFVLVPMMGALFAGTSASGLYVSRTGDYRLVLGLGPPIASLGFLGMAFVDPATSVVFIATVSAVGGFGIGTLLQTLLALVQDAAPRDYLGVATSSTQFSRQLGGAVGVTLVGALLNHGLGPVDLAALSGPNALGVTNSELAKSLAHASQPVSLVISALAALTIIGLLGRNTGDSQGFDNK
ncbi:MAG: MFS transporter [Gemmatimonas sp.]|nr:MFS transporter [Gemmatimonas sp.]